MFLAAGCSNSSGGAPGGAAVPSSCSAPSDLEIYPYDDGAFAGLGLAHAGPIWFSAFGPATSGPAVISGFSPGVPSKVVVHADPTVHSPVTLTGTECSTGGALRFCYGQPDGCGVIGATLTPEQLAQHGFDRMAIDRGSVDYTGYMLFPRAGLYVLTARSGDRVLGTATLAVGESRTGQSS